MDTQIARTLSIVKEMALGKQLTLPEGTLAMGEDMSIGFMVGDRVAGLATMDLAALNKLLEKYMIGFAIGSYYPEMIEADAEQGVAHDQKDGEQN